MLRCIHLSVIFGVILMGSSCTTIVKRSSSLEPLVWLSAGAGPTHLEIHEGAKVAASAHGLPVLHVSSITAMADTKSGSLQGIEIRNHDGFCIPVRDAFETPDIFKRLEKKKKPVVVYGEEPEGQAPAPFAVCWDIRRTAEVVCEKLSAILDGTGQVLLVQSKEGDGNEEALSETVDAFLSSHPGLRLRQKIVLLSGRENDSSPIRTALEEGGTSIHGILAMDLNATRAVAGVLADWNAGRDEPAVHCVGVGSDPAILAAVENKTIDATVAQNYFGVGYISCMLAARLVEGWTPVKTFSTIDVGHVIVTRQNMFTFQEELWGISDFALSTVQSKYLHPPRNSSARALFSKP